MAKYKCVEDRQNGDWCVGLSLTAPEWLDKMVDWMENDNIWDNDEERDTTIKFWEKKIAEGREENLIAYIDEVWDITLVKEE